MSLHTLFENSEIGNMKSRLRSLENKRDKIAIEIAKIQNLPNVWSLDMVDWDDPEISQHKESIFQVINDINDLYWKIEEAKALTNNDYDRYLARKTVYEFLDTIDDNEAFDYLKQVGLTSIGLIEEVMKNPDFIKETYKVKV